jgi:hypothetical protein
LFLRASIGDSGTTLFAVLFAEELFPSSSHSHDSSN